MFHFLFHLNTCIPRNKCRQYNYGGVFPVGNRKCIVDIYIAQLRHLLRQIKVGEPGVLDALSRDQRKALSQTLTTYARRNPDTIRGRLSPVIVYDPITAKQYFGGAMRALKSA